MSIYLQFEIFLKNQKGVVKYDYRDVEGAVPFSIFYSLFLFLPAFSLFDFSLYAAPIGFVYDKG